MVVDTIEQAEFDLRSLNVTEHDEEVIERNLREVSISGADRYVGDVRIRTIGDYDVAFVVTREGELFVITLFAVTRKNELAGWFDVVQEASLATLPESVRILLKGRKRRLG